VFARSMPIVPLIFHERFRFHSNDVTRRMADFPHDKTVVAHCRGPYGVLAAEAVQLRARRLPLAG
jgi:hypothetical protein